MAVAARCLAPLGLVLAASTCSGIDADATLVSRCPDSNAYESLSGWVEASCGTLDCHGQLARPLKVYGERGLRLAADDTAGGAVTTLAEREATVHSICSLEPERMNDVLDGRAPASDLLVVGKARAEVAHKGGRLTRAGDAADVCLTSWLSGRADPAACMSIPP